jgi:hypothetical protein
MRESSFVAATLLLVTVVVTGQQPVRAQTDRERIAQGVELIKLGCGTGTSRTVSVQGDASEGLTLRAPAGDSSGAGITYNKEETQGLIAALKKELTDNAEHLSEVQIQCMKPYIDRIFDLIIPRQPEIPPAQLQFAKLNQLAEQFDSQVRKRVQGVHFIPTSDQNCHMLQQQILMVVNPQADFVSQLHQVSPQADLPYLQQYENHLRANFANKDYTLGVLISRAIGANCAVP